MGLHLWGEEQWGERVQYTCLLKAARAVTPGTKQVFDMVSVFTVVPVGEPTASV